MCQPTVFADNEPTVRGVAVLGADRLIWCREGGGGLIRAKPLDGSAAASQLFDPFDDPTDVATDANGSVYYTSRDDGSSVNRWNASGSGNWSVGSYVTPTGISVDGTTIYVAIQSSDSIESSTTTPNMFMVRSTGLNYPADVAVKGGKMYVASGSGILLAAASPPHTVLSPTSRFLDGGTGDLIHTGLALDDTQIYFTIGERGIVARVPIAGGVATVLATGQADPQGIAVTPTAIYWANRGGVGQVMKLAK